MDRRRFLICKGRSHFGSSHLRPFRQRHPLPLAPISGRLYLFGWFHVSGEVKENGEGGRKEEGGRERRRIQGRLEDFQVSNWQEAAKECHEGVSCSRRERLISFKKSTIEL